MTFSFNDLSDRDLLAEVSRLAATERGATARLVASLAEVDARRLYLSEGCSSLFTYCTQVLHLSEHAAYNRIEAARAARKWPVVLEMLAEGSVTLTTVLLVAPLLAPDNFRQVLDAARHKSKREVEQIVAVLAPRPDVPAAIRKLPSAAHSDPPRQERPEEPPASVATGEAAVMTNGESARQSVERSGIALLSLRPAVITPLAPERYKVQFTISRTTHEKLHRAQALLRHAVPNGDPAEIFDRAISLLVEHLERGKLGRAKRPRQAQASRTHSRHIPSAVKRDVWERDAGRCAFVGTEGRCFERGFLEFHHVVPYARGGPATADNIELRCRSHNQYEARPSCGVKDGAETPESRVL